MKAPKREFSRGFEEHKRAQATMGLRLTPAERLRWLEESKATLARWCGRALESETAQDASTVDEKPVE